MITKIMAVLLIAAGGVMAAPTIHAINPALEHSLLGTFNTVPESPDGSRIAYVHFPYSPSNGSDLRPCQLWVCDRDLSNQRKVCDLPGEVNNHNGADIFWLNNEIIIAQSVAQTDSTYDRMINAYDAASGTVIWEYFGVGVVGHHAWQEKLLVGVGKQSEPDSFGIFEVDGLTGTMIRLMGPDSLATACPELVSADGAEPVHQWAVQHCQYSTDGSHILFRLDVIGSSIDKQLITMKADGTDIQRFSTEKPMHQLWYDGNTIMGHDDGVPDGVANDYRCARWDRAGNRIEALAGPGCHLGVSDDRQLYASETWYNSNPVIFSLYAKGNTTPIRTIFSSGFNGTVWSKNCHVNPSFSADGKRLYFNYPTSDRTAQASFIELDDTTAGDPDLARFNAFEQLPWETKFTQGTGDWQDDWMLDGLKATLSQDSTGLELHAGSTEDNDSDHVVLWTKDSFSGSVRMDYEFTKLDDAIKQVCILYLQATGSGDPGYAEDISLWNSKRTVPSMRIYFNNMNTYHISYAAFGTDNDGPDDDYVRARRYTCAGLSGTEFGTSYERTGLWKKNVPYRVTVIKHDGRLMMRVASDTDSAVFSWSTASVAPISEGRIGLRHMYTRGARYKNMTIACYNDTAVSDTAVVPAGAVIASGDDGNVPENTLDGDLNTRWSSSGTAEWIRYDLDDTLSVVGVSIAFQKGNERTASFSVDVSLNGSDWTNALDTTESSGSTLDLEAFAFTAPVPARYVRINGYGNSDSEWNSYTEVRIDTAAQTTSIRSGDKGGRFPLNIFASPLPAADRIALTLPGAPGVSKTVTLADYTGNICRKIVTESMSAELDVRDLPAGIYILEISDGERHTARMVPVAKGIR